MRDFVDFLRTDVADLSGLPIHSALAFVGSWGVMLASFHGALAALA
jgi:hypothetical protein